jgi:hypothetical protein
LFWSELRSSWRCNWNEYEGLTKIRRRKRRLKDEICWLKRRSTRKSIIVSTSGYNLCMNQDGGKKKRRGHRKTKAAARNKRRTNGERANQSRSSSSSQFETSYICLEQKKNSDGRLTRRPLKKLRNGLRNEYRTKVKFETELRDVRWKNRINRKKFVASGN